LAVHEIEFDSSTSRFTVASTTSGGGGGVSTAVVIGGPSNNAVWATFDARSLAAFAAGRQGGPGMVASELPTRAGLTHARAQVARVVVVPRGAEHAADDIASAFALWGERGRSQFAEQLAGAKRAAAAMGARLVLWPRVGTLVSDIPGVLNLIRGHEDVGVLFDPVGLLAPDSSRFAADFLKRAAEVVSHAAAGIDAVYVANDLPAGVDAAWLEPVIAAAIEARVAVCRGPRAGA
jgi:hypothetical protein